ncbi:MAG: domain S-box, partial [Gemmatimonadetes bacterium]|nr:domain S-box [Gemmatimonadota bacterium]
MSTAPYTPLTTAQVMAAPRDLLDNARVRGLEATIRRRDAVLDAVCYAASHFLGSADWHRDAQELLRRLGTAAEVNHVYLFEGYRSENGTLHRKLRHEWAAEGHHGCECEPAMRDVEIATDGPGHLLEQGQIIHGPLSALPVNEREYFGRMGVKSFAAVPVFVGELWWGYLGLTDEAGERDWSRSILEAIQAAAGTLGAAIYRMQAEEQLRESEERFRRLTEAAFEGVLIHDAGVVLAANPAFARIFGYGVDELVGRNLLDLIPTPESRAIIVEHMRNGSDETYEVTGRRKDGTLLVAEITARPFSYQGRLARVATINDVTERKRSEQTERRLLEEQAARAVAEDAEHRAQMLAEASRLLGSSFDYQTTLSTLTRLAVPALADFCTLDLLGADGAVERVGVAHVDPTKEQLLWDIMRYVQTGAPMVPHLHRALVDGEPTLSAALTDAMIVAAQIDEEHGVMLRALEPRCFVCVPLRASGSVVGALSIYSSISGRCYDAADLALAEELARRAGLAVENARLFHEAGQATRARDQMLGIVAHDLRNP